MSTLYVLGDSFSYPHNSSSDLWPIIAAKSLSEQINTPLKVINKSYLGCSQDYIWKQLIDIEKEITPNDYLVIVLTSPDRFWLREDRPEWSNIQTLDNAVQVTNDPVLQQIILGFMTRIWRDSLSRQHQEHRLGYLSYLKIQKKLKSPIILKAFDSTNINERNYPDLIFSQSYLSFIQLNEWELFDQTKPRMDPILESQYWCHVDCRYNHLTLSNHKVLGNIIGKSLLNGTSPELSSEKFVKKIITVDNHKDENFAKTELNYKWYKEMINAGLRTKLAAKKIPLLF